MKIQKRIAVLMAALCIFVTFYPPLIVEAESPVIVMIDPGHGGSNMGGQFNTLDEKNLTMVTALAMKEELEKYEGVTVYMTRYSDADVSLEQRAQAAANVKADYLISLHYNMSAEHNLYGAEVWIPSVGTEYAKGYALGNLMLDEFDTYGLFRRGVKTKVSSKGKDYYGVIRASSERGIPAVIVEHCHLDNPVDKPIYNSIENLQKFGKSDATAVAKYFGLRSDKLGVDYSGYPKQQTSVPTVAILQDMTPPERAVVTVTYNRRKEDGTLGMLIEGNDRESGIFYYSYSLDGGVSWSALYALPYGTKSVTVECKPADNIVDKRIKVRLYNGYDGMTESAPVSYT